MSLDPDIAALLEMVQAGTESGARVPFPQLTAAQARADFDASSPLLDVDPPALAYERRLSLPVRDGAIIEARLYASAQPSERTPIPVLLYMHGGGFVVGSLDSHQPLCRGLAKDSGAAVLSVGYRLAPEHKFPTAFEDAVDALAWIGLEGRAIGLDPRRVAVGGDSAGGTLAAALAIEARTNRGLPQPVLQILAYPGLSSRQTSASYQRYGTGHLLERSTVDWFFRQYLRDESDRDDWRFAPLAADDLSGLAPACIVLAEFDPLVDEGNDYAARLAAAGVPVDLHVYPGMIHEFLRMGNVVADALQARAAIGRALAKAFLAAGENGA
ncbi:MULTISPECIES: alpha/beta hydrolase [Bradyrhizobium]|uniref:alpha/beta hydrolase n=1 Tax=Bradyrhizobium TaxID=374 RepID=UPI001CD1A7E9|nr:MULTISPECIES: alpha/beta hydrolase [unclassified Bradyrhizobium]MCA1425792.1 alpha/beta hydrolase [Bradyrhizobium sp. NBAIM16]MCA1503153.1 alpha/beta hydrolase [Bradyrhizobium sp. NBAIM02]UWU87327.1 alpha/beta hydrolase [Bradyrhizobium sp. CB1024]